MASRSDTERKDVMLATVAVPPGGNPDPPRFAVVARALFQAREEFLTHTGNINWMAVSEQLPGVHYETLRKALAGDRQPTVELMEAVARLAEVDPTLFVEYRLHLARREFNVREVGFETAAANLKRWAEASTKKPKR